MIRGIVFGLSLFVFLHSTSGQSSLSTTPQISSAFNRLINAYARNHHFNGTILVEQAGRQIYKQSFGHANFQFNIRNTNDTKYKIASITKLFTSVLIMQLVEDGKLRLDEPVKPIYPTTVAKEAER